MSVEKRRLFLSIGVLLVVGLFAFFIVARPEAVSYPEDVRDVGLMREAIAKEIASKGAEPAYTSFKNVFESRAFSVQHNAAHLFGEGLYESLGTSGVSVCDESLNYGCYHGFLTRAIAGEGLAVVPTLDAACAASDNHLRCQHGIGHGILEYTGHTNLDEALAACDLTNQSDPIGGCTSGVFMEYNVPLTVAENGSFSVASRVLPEGASPYTPCPTLPAKYREGCYYSLPQWWKQIYINDFKRIGVLCEGLENEREKNACLIGTGSIAAPTSEFMPSRTIALCDDMPSPPGRSTCLASAAGAYRSNQGDEVGARIVCEAASPSTLCDS